MKIYRIPVTYNCTRLVYVPAETIEDAINYVYDYWPSLSLFDFEVDVDKEWAYEENDEL